MQRLVLAVSSEEGKPEQTHGEGNQSVIELGRRRARTHDQRSQSSAIGQMQLLNTHVVAVRPGTCGRIISTRGRRHNGKRPGARTEVRGFGDGAVRCEEHAPPTDARGEIQGHLPYRILRGRRLHQIAHIGMPLTKLHALLGLNAVSHRIHDQRERYLDRYLQYR